MNNIKTEKITNRLYHHIYNGKSTIEDKYPPIFLLPFITDSSNEILKYLFLHEYTDINNVNKTTVLGVNQYNFDSNIDVVKTFTSKYFSLPVAKIDIDRIFYLGEIDIDISLFKSKTQCYSINLTGLLRDDENKINLGEDGNLVKVSYTDVYKSNYADVMVMSTTFQLMSYYSL